MSSRALSDRGGRRPPVRSRFWPIVAAVAAIVLVVSGALLVAQPAIAPTPPPTDVALGSSTPTSATSPTDTPSASPSGSPSVAPTSTVGPTPSFPPATDRGYLTSVAELHQRAAAASAGHEPEADAVADLIDRTTKVVDAPPHPENPLSVRGTNGVFVSDTANAYTLALDWATTGDPAAGAHARDIVLAWVRTARSTRNTCATGGQCQTSLVISRNAPGFVFAVDLLATDRSVWTPADDQAFRAWLRTVILPAASDRTNNWGDAGTLLRLVGSDYLGDQAGVDRAIALWRSRLDLITSEGEIPEETRRGHSGMLYTQEALLYKTAVAVIAGRRGIDLWSATGARGGSLKGAIDLLADYWVHPEDWPWNDHVDRPDPGPLWEMAYAHWQDPAYAAIVLEGRPFGPDGHSAVRWTTLTSGIPVATP